VHNKYLPALQGFGVVICAPTTDNRPGIVVPATLCGNFLSRIRDTIRVSTWNTTCQYTECNTNNTHADNLWCVYSITHLIAMRRTAVRCPKLIRRHLNNAWGGCSREDDEEFDV